MRRIVLLAGLAAAAVTGCIPYTVGTTAQPAPVGGHATSLMLYAMPPVEWDTSYRSQAGSGSHLTSDAEVRWGINKQSDAGVRLVGFSGVVVNYKRMLTDTSRWLRAAIMPGLGFVNGGQHFYTELNAILSTWEPSFDASERPREFMVVGYGGLRASQVMPIQENAVHDQPTYGVRGYAHRNRGVRGQPRNRVLPRPLSARRPAYR